MRSIAVLLVCLFPLLTNAKKIKVSVEPTYVKTKKTPYKESWTDVVVKSFKVEIGKSIYLFEAASDSMMSWTITINEDQVGAVNFIVAPTEDEKNKWEFDFGKSKLTVSFFGYNDPREFQFETDKGDYVMASGEPDCNSIFILYDYLEENLWDYDFKKAAGEGYADDACQKTGWKFTFNKEGISNDVMLSYIFTSVVAQNVRAFKY